MFFRTKIINGSRLLQLVESYRNEEFLPRQCVVASLGNAVLPEGESKKIARTVESTLRGEMKLFPSDLSMDAARLVTHIVQIAQRSKSVKVKNEVTTLDGVLIKKVKTENVVELGPQLVALKAWDELGLSKTLEKEGMSQSEIVTAQLIISNRLIEPLSEWDLIDWSERTAIPELLDMRITKTTKDRLYRTSDKLLRHRKNIETALCQKERDLFSLPRSVILYDVTNTHFEGDCKANPKAKHGRNKQKRDDCRQVAIGLAFDEQGFALAHKVFEGNTGDTTTLARMLERLVLKDETGKPVVILDAGFASEANIRLLEEKGYCYLINVTRNSREKYKEYFDREVFAPLPNRAQKKQVEVKVIVDPENSARRLVLCRSNQRRLKEMAIISNAERRFVSDAERLSARIEKGSLKKPELIERKIGALKQKHPRVARFYTVQHEKGRLIIARDDAEIEEVLSLCGDYVLKTDQNIDASTLWSLYMTLLKAESGFRLLKGYPGLRPNYHQLESRVDGHIFISVIAYHLLTWIRNKFEHTNDTCEWKTIRRLLRTHCIVTTRFPLKDGRIVSIRKPSVPDAEQAHVYSLLGIQWEKAFPPVQTEVKKGTTL